MTTVTVVAMGITATLSDDSGTFVCTMDMTGLPAVSAGQQPPQGGIAVRGITQSNLAMPVTIAITGATNATPIQVTTAVPHNLTTGQSVFIAGVAGNTATNGAATVTVVDSLNVTIARPTTATPTGAPVAGNGAYAGGGVLSYQLSTPQPAQQAAPPLITSFSPPTGSGGTTALASLAAAVALYNLTGGSTGTAGVSAASAVQIAFSQAS